MTGDPCEHEFRQGDCEREVQNFTSVVLEIETEDQNSISPGQEAQ